MMKDKDRKPINASFEDWISNASIYIGYARYGQLGGHGFVVATCYGESGELEKAVYDLDAGDNEALAAGHIIEEMDCWYANDPDPAVAMQKFMAQMREFQRCMDEDIGKAVKLYTESKKSKTGIEARFSSSDGEHLYTIENYDMGTEIGIWPVATENDYGLVFKHTTSDGNQILYFRKGFSGCPKTLERKNGT